MCFFFLQPYHAYHASTSNVSAETADDGLLPRLGVLEHASGEDRLQSVRLDRLCVRRALVGVGSRLGRVGRRSGFVEPVGRGGTPEWEEGQVERWWVDGEQVSRWIFFNGVLVIY